MREMCVLSGCFSLIKIVCIVLPVLDSHNQKSLGEIKLARLTKKIWHIQNHDYQYVSLCQNGCIPTPAAICHLYHEVTRTECQLFQGHFIWALLIYVWPLLVTAYWKGQIIIPHSIHSYDKTSHVALKSADASTTKWFANVNRPYLL